MRCIVGEVSGTGDALSIAHSFRSGVLLAEGSNSHSGAVVTVMAQGWRSTVE